MSISRVIPSASRVVVLLFLLYSVAHFVQSGVGGPGTPADARCGGDFNAVFPGPISHLVRPELYSERTAWNYGPVANALQAPLALLPDRGAVCTAWLLTNLAFLGIAAALLFRGMFGPFREVPPLLCAAYVCMWLNFYPLLEALHQGVIEIFELMLMVVAYSLLKTVPAPARTTKGSRTDVLVGLIAALAAMTKFLPAIMIPYFVIKARWTALLVGGAAIGVIALVTQATLGWQNNVTLDQIDPLSGFRLWQHSQSLTTLVLRQFASFPDGLAGTSVAVLSEDVRSVAFASARLAVIAALVAFTVLFALRRRARTLDLEFALLLAFMVFIPQWNIDYYTIFLLVPLTVLLRWARPTKDASWRPRAALVAACYVATGSLIVPASLVDSLFALPSFGTLRLMQNLSLPAVANLAMLVTLGWWYARSAPLDERRMARHHHLAVQVDG